jgi:putative membrane protein
LKYLMWLLNAAIFFVLFAFALNNQEPITLRLFFGAQWQAPLVLILLLTLLLGVVLGVIVMLPLWLRARKARHAKPDASASTMLDNDSTLQPDPRDIRHGL